MRPLPSVRHPMLATLVGEPFDDRGWVFETKWDGVRALCRIDGTGVSMRSRNGKDLLVHFPEFAAIHRALRGTPALLDGEIVTFDARGRSSFQRLQPRVNLVPGGDARLRPPVTYVVFDVLFAHGRDLRREPLDERKRVLRAILRGGSRLVRFSRHVVGAGRRAFARAKRRRLEGIIGKRRASTYQERRSRDWVKIKLVQQQEVVIGGWTDPKGSRDAFGALLAGVYQRGKLVFAGGVGTGFDRAVLESVKKRLRPLETDRSPFSGAHPARAHWVRPRLVCEVKFGEWTRGGIMRQPVFLGLRTDKPGRAVVRESPARGRMAR